MSKEFHVIAAYGDMVVYVVKPKVYAVYQNGRFGYNLRPADEAYRAPMKRLREVARARAEAKADRAARVAFGRERKAAARAANAAAASIQPNMF